MTESGRLCTKRMCSSEAAVVMARALGINVEKPAPAQADHWTRWATRNTLADLNVDLERQRCSILLAALGRVRATSRRGWTGRRSAFLERKRLVSGPPSI